MVNTDVLWGGTLISLTLDPVDWRLRAEVDVTGDGNVRRYVLVLEEVSDPECCETSSLAVVVRRTDRGPHFEDG
jgi:hypothetical protein